MRKNIWLFTFLIIIFFILLARCTGMRFSNDKIEEAPLQIAPIPQKTVELVNLYFGNSGNEYLVKEQRAIERSIESKEEVILRELINGPRDYRISATIPKQTRLYSVTTAEGICYVNFSKEFADNFNGDEREEITAVYSIVNSLTELNHISKVQILVEGERLELYRQILSLREAYSRNEKLLTGPFLSPIEVLKQYFAYIERGEYRYAYNQIYRPGEYNLDYSLFFRYLRENKSDTVAFTIVSYSITPEDKRSGTITIEYVEEFEDGTSITHEQAEFQYENDFGEWKIIFKEL